MPEQVKSQTPEQGNEYEALETSTGSLFEEFYAIYVQSIAERERKSKAQIGKMIGRPDYRITLARKGQAVVGFSILFIPEAASFCLLEYMAVDSALRNQGLGAGLFRHAMKIASQKKPNDPVILEVDSDREKSADQSMRRRRQAFYRRLGCLRLDGLHYLMPLPGDGPPPEMDLLVFSFEQLLELPKAQVEVWLKTIYQEVYGCAVNDPRIEQMMRQIPDPAKLV